jgi:amino acid adenylation domain-containing protein
LSTVEYKDVLQTEQELEEYDAFPASSAQKRLWFLDELHPGNPAYTLSFPKRIRGPLNVRALERSLQEIVIRHESLRTVFRFEEGQLLQIVMPEPEWSVTFQDAEGTEEAKREELSRSLAEAEALKPFDLSKGPLFRAALVRFSETDHLLLLSIHHIVFDGWSVNVLFEELQTLYRSFCQNEMSPLEDLEIQYGDYAVWQQEWLESDEFKEKLRYWKERLHGHQALLELPTDRARSRQSRMSGSSYEFAIPADTAAKLAEISLSEHATLFMTYMTAFQLFLYRYSGQDDFCIGSLHANRGMEGLENLIGFFVNTLAHRVQIRKNISFLERLREVRKECLEAFENAEVPFDLVVEEVGGERSLHHSSIFQVMFEYQTELSGETELSLPGLSVTSVHTEGTTAKFDLSLYIRQRETAVCGMFEYNSDLFDRSTIERMAEHFLILLYKLAEKPEQAVETLSLLTPKEQEFFEQTLQSTHLPTVPPACLHTLFERQAERTPDNVAVEFEDQAFTYRELNQQANQLARCLRRKGVGRHDRVGLYLERSASMIVAILAVLKTGAAYVPIDPSSPAERAAFILQDSEAAVLLTAGSSLPDLPEKIQVIDLTQEALLQQEETDNPHFEVEPDDLAYIIYTSGSTGQPKGVLIEHRNVHRLFSESDEWFGFSEKDVWTLFHSYAFDFSVWEMWGALLYGGKLVIVPYWLSRSPDDFYRLLIEKKVTVLNQTPSSFQQIIQVDQRESSPHLHLRYVIFGGEALDFRMLRPWVERHGDERPQLINMYGITETTVHVTYRPIRRNDVQDEAGSRIGVPLPDLKVYVLDERLQPVPTGVFGEMYVEGPGLARGYWNRPELTRERFIRHPFSKDPNRKLYKTGDIARLLPNGELEYRGRADLQVKIRGFRIELGEIESVLLKHPEVAQAVVTVKTFPGGQQGLVGYIVLKSGRLDENVDHLRSFLSSRLPDYMVPSALLLLERIPLTINGKTDVRALPAPDLANDARAKSYVAPATEEERIMVGIWEEVLQVEQIGVEDNYFHLGGDSIRSLQILYRARDAGLHFVMQDLFQHQTVRALLQARNRRSLPEEEAKAVVGLSEKDKALLPSDIVDAYPMSQGQIGMIYHSQLQSGANLYHNVHSMRLKAKFSEDAWKRAVQELVQRHPVLRTSFDLVRYSQPMQLVHREVDVPLTIYDLRSLSPKEQEEMLLRHFENERNSPFDFSRAPLLRFFIHRCSEDEFQLGITEHHAILDGWSVAALQAELFQLYLFHQGLAAPLPAAPRTAFRDFIGLEQAALTSQTSRDFWRRQLLDAPFNKLPRLQERKSEQSDMRFEHVTLAPELCVKLKDAALSLKVPIKSVLLAAHLRVLSLICNQQDIVTGVVWNGRPEEQDSERLLGMFLNTLPFRLQLGDGTWSDLIRATFKQEQCLLPHRRFPLAELHKEQEGQPLFETFFNFTHFHNQNRFEGHHHLRILEERSHADTNFALGAEFSQNPLTGELSLGLRWDASEFSEEQIGRVIGYYLSALQEIGSRPQSRHAEALLLSKEEQECLKRWNDTDRPYSMRCLHELFEEQVSLAPNRIAVHAEGTEWTYAHLNDQANRIAQTLVQKGVGANVKVGLLFERCPELVASLLGILKAGGAYVPFDPESPTERLAFLLEDADVPVLLTQAKWKHDLPPIDAEILFVEECLEQEVTGPFVAAKPADLDSMAYMIYTSGSTGKPKGAMISHRSICNRLLWMQEEYRLDDTDCVLQKTPYSFDVSVWEFFWPLLAGAKIVMAKPGGHKSPSYLADLIESQSVTTIHFVPSMLSVFTEAADPEKCRSLRRVFSSGESLSVQLQKKFLKRFGTDLHNLYGPTEAAVDVSYWKCKVDHAQSLVPIGRPVANTQLHILNENLQPVPIGTPGELYIGGVQVGLGYHNREGLTRERFIPDPFRPGGRLYKTGDIARFLPDGNIEYLGRNDDQVKIHGLRIELGEIESILREHAAVLEAVVAVDRNERGEARLLAFAVAASQWQSQIEQHLKQRLPAYMVPQLFLVDEIPVTPNGKADRKALLALAADLGPQRDRPIMKPADELEAKLVLIWEDILGRKPIGIQDHFFELGGHSLAAIRLIACINEQFQVELPVSALIQHVTIQELATAIRAHTTAAPASPLIRFRTSGQGQNPFFFIHPIGGSAYCYAVLAAHLERAYTVYALQSLGLQDVQHLQGSVAEMADTYLKEIKNVQPEGPYRIGGWSFGGLVAFEVARRLRKQGEEVALLALFDSYAPIGNEARPALNERDLQVRFLRDLLSTTVSEQADEWEAILSNRQDPDKVIPLLKERGMLPQEFDKQHVDRMYKVFCANVQAERHYSLAPEEERLQVPVLLVRAEAGFDEEDDPLLGWGPWICSSCIQVKSVSANHYSLMQDPHVKVLADLLQEADRTV